MDELHGPTRTSAVGWPPLDTERSTPVGNDPTGWPLTWVPGREPPGPDSPVDERVSRETNRSQGDTEAPPAYSPASPTDTAANLRPEPTDTAAGESIVPRETDGSPESEGIPATAGGAEPRAPGQPLTAAEIAARPVLVARHTEPSSTPLAVAAEAAARALHDTRRAFPRPPSTRVIVVANQKGGVGKTTTAVNVAAALAQHGARVLLVDLDPQGNASTALGIAHHAGTPSMYEVLVRDAPIESVVRPADGVARLDCAPATIDLSGAEVELVSFVAREIRLRRALDRYLQRTADEGEPYDYVFIDCPPSLGLLTINALAAGAEVLLPIQCEYYALEGVGQLVRIVDLVRSQLNPDLHVSTVLLTMFDARTRLAAQVADEVRAHFGSETLATAIPRSVRITEAPSYSQTVMTYDPGSSGALSYLEAAREIAQRGDVPVGASGSELAPSIRAVS